MIESIIKQRMILAGLTQAKLANMSDCTANQMGIFLKGSGFLSKTSLEKCLEVLGIRLDIFSKRYILAQKAAEKLKDKDQLEILTMPKAKMALVTGIPEIMCLFDVSESELDNIINSGFIDVEVTYPYFKAMVIHMKEIGSSPTPKKVEMSFSKLASICAAVPALPLLGITSIIGIATGLLLGSKYSSSLLSNALTPLLVLAKQIVKK